MYTLGLIGVIYYMFSFLKNIRKIDEANHRIDVEYDFKESAYSNYKGFINSFYNVNKAEGIYSKILPRYFKFESRNNDFTIISNLNYA